MATAQPAKSNSSIQADPSGEKHDLRWKLVVIGLLALGVFYAEDNVVVATSGSVEHRWFWRTGEIAARGDYATFMLDHPLAGDKPVRLTKRLVCWAGDELAVRGQDYYCNDWHISRAKRTGLNGQPLPQFVYQGRILPGKAFAAGNHIDSFDSRYWGFVDISQTERLVPIFARHEGRAQ